MLFVEWERAKRVLMWWSYGLLSLGCTGGAALPCQDVYAGRRSWVSEKKDSMGGACLWRSLILGSASLP